MAAPPENALAATITGLFETEVIHHRGPWRPEDLIEFATLELPQRIRAHASLWAQEP